MSSTRVLAGSSPQNLAPVATVAKNGFETAIPLAQRADYVAVQTLSDTDTVLGTSPAAHLG